MGDEWIGYDRGRVAALDRNTRAAIGQLDGVHSDEPFAADAVASAQRIGEALRTVWLPTFARVSGSTAMTEWHGYGPTGSSGGGGTRVQLGPAAASDRVDETAAEMVSLTEAATASDETALARLSELIAGAETGELQAYLAALGPLGFAALLRYLESVGLTIDDIDPDGNLTDASVEANRQLITSHPYGWVVVIALETTNEDDAADADGNMSGDDHDAADRETVEARIWQTNEPYDLGLSEAEIAELTDLAMATATIADLTGERDQFDGDGALIGTPGPTGGVLLARRQDDTGDGERVASGPTPRGEWTAVGDWSLGLAPITTASGQPQQTIDGAVTGAEFGEDAEEVPGSVHLTDDGFTGTSACGIVVGWEHVGTEYRTMTDTIQIADGVTVTVTYTEDRAVYYAGDCIGVGPFSRFNPSPDELRHDAWTYDEIQSVEFFVDGQSVSALTVAELYEGPQFAIVRSGHSVVTITPGSVEVEDYGSYSAGDDD